MERKYFKWEEWDEAGDFIIQFYDCEVVKEFGDYKVGNKIDTISIDFQNGSLAIYDEEVNLIKKYSIEMNVLS